MNNKIGISFSVALASLFPLVTFAAPRTFSGLVAMFISFINPMAAILASIALLIFFYGIFQYIYSGGGEDHENGRQLMMWGVIALFVMVAVWSLANILSATFLGGGSSVGGGSGTLAPSTLTSRPYLNL